MTHIEVAWKVKSPVLSYLNREYNIQKRGGRVQMSSVKEKIEQKWKHFFEHSLEMVLFFDEKGIVLEGNQTAKTELGYGDGLEGTSVCTIFQKVLQYENG